jgi:gluconate 2-dehydrogenase subunit 3-like protein
MNASDQPAPTESAIQHSSEPGTLSRREVSRRLLSVAAILHLDALHPVWKHLPLQPAAEDAANPGGTKTKPALLTPDQLADFAGIAEGIVPGSAKALVAPFVDLLLSVDQPPVQQQFIRSLAVLQQEGQRRFAATLAALTPSQRDEILAAVSTAQAASPQLAAFADLKTWVVGAYYSSEPGMTELGWTPSRFFDSLPACSHADHSE